MQSKKKVDTEVVKKQFLLHVEFQVASYKRGETATLVWFWFEHNPQYLRKFVLTVLKGKDRHKHKFAVANNNKQLSRRHRASSPCINGRLALP